MSVLYLCAMHVDDTLVALNDPPDTMSAGLLPAAEKAIGVFNLEPCSRVSSMLTWPLIDPALTWTVKVAATP